MTNQPLYVDTAYQIICETQRKLHAEYVMSSTFEEFLNQDNLKTFKQSFISQNIKEKHYYTRVLFLTTFNSNKIPFTNNNAFYLEDTESEIFQIPHIFNPSKSEVFARKLISLEERGALSNQLIDIITFSIIPSFFLMFLEKNAFTLFRKFINKFKKDTKPTQLGYQLSRSLFVSPMFLSFLRKIMHDILQPVYSSESSFTSTSRLQQLILDSFTKNVCFIPSYINLFFEKNDYIYEFLKECLFTPFIANPENFEIIDFNAKNDEKLHNFTEILKTIFDDEFIKQIAGIIKENKNSEKSIFIPEKEEIEQTKAETNTIILDTIDKIVLFHLQQLFEEKVDPNFDLFESFTNVKYEMYRSLFEIKKKEKKNDAFLLATVINKSGDDDNEFIWMFFRKLLKNAQPLPVASGLEHEPMNIDSFIKLIKKFILTSCDPFQIVDAEIPLQQFSSESFTDNKTISSKDEFVEKMKNLVVKHDEQTIVMQLISKFQKELKFLTQSRQSSLDLMNKRFIVHLLDLHKIDENLDGIKIPTKSYDMIKYPQKYLDDFNKYMEVQKPKILKLFSFDCNKILCGRFYQNLDFYTYLTVRSDLRKFDDIAFDIFTRFINEVFENVDGKMDIIVSKVKNMSVFNSSFSKLNDSFNMNGDPITKLIEISSCIQKIIQDLALYSGEYGRDYSEPFINYVFATICPHHYVSNVVFIAEYLDYFNSMEIENDNMFLTLVSSFESITEKEPIFREYPLIRLTRTMNKRCELFISGNDPKIVAESLNAFVTMINQKNKMSDENVASLANDINKEKGKVFLLQVPALRFNKKKMLFFTIFDIRVGVDIKLDKVGNKDYMLRLALFFFQKPKNMFGKSELKNFINYNQFDNKYKRIIPTGDFNASDANGIQVLNFNNCWNNISEDIYNVFLPSTTFF